MIVTKGKKDVTTLMIGTDRELVTVLACGNAAGEMLRPLSLCNGIMHIYSRFDGADENCRITTNASGVMDHATFADYSRREVFPIMTTPKVCYW